MRPKFLVLLADCISRRLLFTKIMVYDTPQICVAQSYCIIDISYIKDTKTEPILNESHTKQKFKKSLAPLQRKHITPKAPKTATYSSNLMSSSNPVSDPSTPFMLSTISILSFSLLQYALSTAVSLWLGQGE